MTMEHLAPWALPGVPRHEADARFRAFQKARDELQNRRHLRSIECDLQDVAAEFICREYGKMTLHQLEEAFRGVMDGYQRRIPRFEYSVDRDDLMRHIYTRFRFSPYSEWLALTMNIGY